MNATHADLRPAPTIKRGVNHFAADVGALLDLQGELFVAEAQELSCSIRRTCQLLIVSTFLSVAALPLLLASLAAYLNEFRGFSIAASLAIAGGGALVLSVCLCAAAFQILRNRPRAFPKFRYELRRNLKWLVETIRRDGTGTHAA